MSYCRQRKPNFARIFRGLLVPCSNAICGRDGFTRNFGRSRHENLSGAISWLTFSLAEQRTPGEFKVNAAPRRARETLQDGGRRFVFRESRGAFAVRPSFAGPTILRPSARSRRPSLLLRSGRSRQMHYFSTTGASGAPSPTLSLIAALGDGRTRLTKSCQR